MILNDFIHIVFVAENMFQNHAIQVGNELQMIDIFMTSWYRFDMTKRAINEIRTRTTAAYRLHICDNGSDIATQSSLIQMLNEGLITSLLLDSRNTGCAYNKGIFHAMADGKYYVVTDNDIYPPDLSPDWLAQMIDIMDRHPKLAMLTPSVPPLFLMDPNYSDGEVVFCKAVGNALKLVRREAIPQMNWSLFQYGDDGALSQAVQLTGWEVGFCQNIFCKHAGQTKNWGYKEDEIAKDPRKKGYGPPYISDCDPVTYEPVSLIDRWQ
jgi:glycosyltransferase involved in cell wall biosynthesis